MSGVPVFAVVGRVNKGKSSVIATLAEDERVAISPIPGTTRACTEYPVVVDGHKQFVLVDTPGFEDAPAALAWLQSTNPSADERPARVAAFVEHFRGTEDFVEECRLLEPIVDGASILYVVDGTRPYRDNYKSEMEILRWTGRPSMALINRIGTGDHGEAWRRALDQFFKVVRTFDAHRASFEERVRLLEAFKTLDPEASDRLDVAVNALHAERKRRLHEVARIITALIVDSLAYTVEAQAKDTEDPRRLENAFHEHLRHREQTARGEVERLYHHRRVSWRLADDLVRPVFGEDLFAARTWSVLGLSPAQLVALYVVSGAVTGGVVDASVGGASFLAGTAVGSLVGAGAGLWHLQQRFARATSVDGVLGRLGRAFSGERTYRVGPFAHPNFPFILMDRARLHHDAVRTRAHAKNAVEPEAVAGEGGALSSGLSSDERNALHHLFKRIRQRGQAAPDEIRSELLARVRKLIDQSEMPGGRADPAQRA